MSERIAQVLAQKFEQHRIVFWYDTKRELRAAYETLDLPGIEKLEIKNNQFTLKYRILREQPEQKFLIYHEGPQPEDIDNWLLDVQLAQDAFHSDQAGIWLAELGLGFEFEELVAEHAEFFQAVKRRVALKKSLKPEDTLGKIRMKMLAICAGCGSDPRLDAILDHLLNEVAAKENGERRNQDGERIKLIQRCKLDDYFWEQIERRFSYFSTEPTIMDFAIQLFNSCYVQHFDESASSLPRSLSSDALVFLKRWKDSRRFEDSFERLSAECAEVLNIEQDLNQRDFRELIDLDFFCLIEQKIISDLVKAVSLRTVKPFEVSHWIRQRRQGHWYDQYRYLYQAVGSAVLFLNELDQPALDSDLGPESDTPSGSVALSAWIERYVTHWFRLDQLYRKFVYHRRMSGQTSLLESLSQQIEDLYTNNFLLKVNDRWQSVVDRAERWSAPLIPLQKDFFEHWVEAPFVKKEKKVCVIISDALRYEIGEELLGRIQHEDRFQAEIQPALAMLPSYTQLGMAALLPNKTLTITDKETGLVLLDGKSSQGTARRRELLQSALSYPATALKAPDVLAMNKEECRTMIREHQVVYIYHNRIDMTGDQRDSEGRVFEAVEETLEDLIRLIKKLTGANANNLLVTADHGFIYQDRALEQSDFSEIEASADQILYRDRRFVLGKGLREAPGLSKFSASELSLSGDVEVQIPKSINRLRVKGSGSRFVHGGASVQEVVLPVLKVNKKRRSDIASVEVDILQGAGTTITSGQLSVGFYQTKPVTDKMHGRQLRAGIFTQAGHLISDRHELNCDLASANPRDREFQMRFVFTREAEGANGQEVFLKLEEKHPGTSHYKTYKSCRYLLRRSFTTDFDL